MCQIPNNPPSSAKELDYRVCPTIGAIDILISQIPTFLHYSPIGKGVGGGRVEEGWGIKLIGTCIKTLKMNGCPKSVIKRSCPQGRHPNMNTNTKSYSYSAPKQERQTFEIL